MAEVKDKIITVESLKTVYDTLNENKAPSGYGLGESTDKYFPTSESELNTMLTDAVSKLPNESVGFYTFVDNTGSIFNGGTAHATVFRTNNLYTTVTFVKYHHTDAIKFIKTLYNGTWLPLSWENPPMTVGTEYRTTEKHNGKVVYAKMINFGNLPSSEGNNSVRVFEDNEVPSIEVIDIEGIVKSSSSGTVQKFPIITWSQGAAGYFQYHDNTGYISVLVRQDLSSYNATFKFKYTKD